MLRPQKHIMQITQMFSFVSENDVNQVFVGESGWRSTKPVLINISQKTDPSGPLLFEPRSDSQANWQPLTSHFPIGSAAVTSQMLCEASGRERA